MTGTMTGTTGNCVHEPKRINQSMLSKRNGTHNNHSNAAIEASPDTMPSPGTISALWMPMPLNQQHPQQQYRHTPAIKSVKKNLFSDNQSFIFSRRKSMKFVTLLISLIVFSILSFAYMALTLEQDPTRSTSTIPPTIIITKNQNAAAVNNNNNMIDMDAPILTRGTRSQQQQQQQPTPPHDNNVNDHHRVPTTNRMVLWNTGSTSDKQKRVLMRQYPRIVGLVQGDDDKDNNRQNDRRTIINYRRIRKISPTLSLNNGSSKLVRNATTLELSFSLQQEQPQEDTLLASSVHHNETTSRMDDDDNNNNNNNNDKCLPMAKWMTSSFVNCNSIHEIDLEGSVTPQDSQTDLILLGQGWFRSTWKYTITTTTSFRGSHGQDGNDNDSGELSVSSSSVSIVLKTLRLEREFLEEYYELHRRDAVAMERLTFSPYVMDVYGYVLRCII
jgi:hypothetical protein